MPYEPQPDSLAAHVVGYFRLHPDEYLTLDDIATKFNSGRSNIHTLLARAMDGELLKREKAADGDWIYRPGKECKPMALPALKAEPQSIKVARKRAELDVESLTICDDPLPKSRANPGNKYAPIFAQLKVGQCLKCKTEDVGRIGNAIRKWIENNQLPYTFRVMRRYHSDGQGRVWLLDAPVKAEATKLKKVA